MPVLIPLASGKGGVGKTVISVNLAYQIARRGKTVVLADMDWGGSNAHTLLGLKNTNPGVGTFVSKKDSHLSELILPLEQEHMFFIPGDGLIPGTANMSFIRKQRLIKELRGLTADYVLLDMGAGTTYNTVDVFLACNQGFVVTTPEPTAILNAYSLIKTALFRLLSTSVPAKSPVRALISDFFGARIEGTGLPALLEQVDEIDPEASIVIRERASRFVPRVVINMGKAVQELSLGGRLRQICEKHLGVRIEYIAFVPWDDDVRASIIDRKLLSQTRADGSFSRAVSTIAERICTRGFDELPPPFENFEDLQSLADDAATL